MKISKRINRYFILSVLVVIFAGALAYSIVRTAKFPHWTVDDAFIIFRYAENLVEHGELNWNPGENPVEGYTGFTLVMLISAAIKLGISPVVASHAIGIAFFFMGGILLLLILRGFNIGGVTASALYLTSPFMFVHAWSGLETTMFTAMILFAFYTFALGRNKLFVTSLLLLSFTRPEGVLLSVLLISVYRPLSKPLIAAYLAPCVAYFLWRWIYYGQLLPNTFYAKTTYSSPLDENVESLRILTRNHLRLPALLGLIFFSYEHIRNHKRLIGAALAFTAISLCLYLCSDLVMNYAYRFFVPFYALTLLAMGGIVLGAKRNLKTLLIVVVILSAQLSFNTDKKGLSKLRRHFSSYETLLKDCHIKIGHYLRNNLPPDEWIVVHADAGAIPYYSKLRTCDFGRLNDEFLSRNYPAQIETTRRSKNGVKITAKKQDGEETPTQSVPNELVDYFYAKQPGALVFTSYNNKTLYHGPESNWISSDRRFDDYRLLEIYQTAARRNYCEFLYIRNDLVDKIQSDKRAKRIIRRRSDTPSKEQSNEGVGFRKHDGTPTHDVNVSLSPDSLWTLAGNETNPLLKIELYRRILELSDDDPQEHSACFMIGFIFLEELQDTLSAIAAFEKLIDRYPDEEITDSARWMLDQIRGEKPKSHIPPR